MRITSQREKSFFFRIEAVAKSFRRILWIEECFKDQKYLWNHDKLQQRRFFWGEENKVTVRFGKVGHLLHRAKIFFIIEKMVHTGTSFLGRRTYSFSLIDHEILAYFIF